MRWLVLLAVLVIEARPADACSCDPGSLMYPDEDGVVPVNAAVIWYGPFGLRPTFELRVAGTTELVPITFEIETRDEIETPDGSNDVWFVGRPALVADTDYELLVVGEIPISMHRFRTDATVLPPLEFAGLSEIQTEVMHYEGCIDSCMDLDLVPSRVRLDYPAPSNHSVFTVLSLYRDGTLVDRIPIRALLDTSFIRPSGCAARFELEGDYCASLRTYDAAGQQAGDDVLVCTTTRTCAPKQADNGICAPSSDCDELVEPSSGGCATSSGGTVAFALAALLALRPRRRA